MVTEYSIKNMLPLNLWSKQSLQAAQASESGASQGNASLLAQMQFGHPLSGTPGFLPVSFSSALFRPGEHGPHGLYSYPALHPSFFRPHLDPAALGSLLNHRNMVALHHGVEGSRDSHPSAFTPAKRLRLQDDGHSPRDGRSSHSPRDDMVSRDHDTSGSSTRTSPLTPVHRSSYSPAASLGHRMNGDSMDPHHVHGAEDLRLKWRCEDGDNLRCPICKALLQPGEIRTHLYKEFTSLKETLQAQANNEAHGDRGHGHGCDSETSKSRYDTFLRIRRNRENRLNKLRGDRKRKRYSDELSHTSMLEHDEPMTSDHVMPTSPHRDQAEEETVDVTSCEEPEVAVVYNTSPVHRQSPDPKDETERACVPRPPSFPDQRS